MLETLWYNSETISSQAEKMAGLIYKIENKINGKVYIGQTLQGFGRRISEHLYRLRAGERKHKLYQAMRKHGVENFEFSEIASVPNEADLDDVEMAFIKQYNSFKRGYNATQGGDTLSNETKNLLSKMFKGRPMTWADKVVATRKKNGNYPGKGYGGYGKDHSASKEFLVRAPNGEKIRFKGLRGFCRDHGLSHNLLLTTLTGVQKHHKGYVLLRRFND